MERESPSAGGLPFPRADDAVLVEQARLMADHVAGSLGVALALAESGRRIDLSGLDLTIGRLCARVVDLEPAQGRGLRTRLQGLVTQLDALAARLEPP